MFSRATIYSNPTTNVANIASGTSTGFTNATAISAGNIACVANGGINANINSNINQQQIIINDLNDQYDQNCILDVNVNTFLLNGDTEKYAYSPGYGGWDYEQVDLSDDFKQHYELWLQREVFDMTINWDSLVSKCEYDDDKKNVAREE